jgi:transposase InsO family protein
MPWKDVTPVSERSEFVTFASREGTVISALCRQYGVSRKTGYKWLHRLRGEGWEGLRDRSRRPHRSPRRTPAGVEALVCTLRTEHPAWGGRKLHHALRGDGVPHPPAASTITGILDRTGLLAAERRRQRAWQRFEEASPNGLWQMDFKGHFATGAGRCHPLTVLDDHSRFNLALVACPNERAETVQQHLTGAFQRYGLPLRMLMDNGSPWGSDATHPHTHLTAWLIRLGITVLHGRPYHPQTQGKEERFHRTLAAEVLARQPSWPGLTEVQCAFAAWRDVYNLRRPHEALNHATPASRYLPSARPFPATLPLVEYAPDDHVRRVQDKGRISFKGHEFLVSRAFIGESVALRPVRDGVWDVYYCHQRVRSIDCTGSE